MAHNQQRTEWVEKDTKLFTPLQIVIERHHLHINLMN